MCSSDEEFLLESLLFKLTSGPKQKKKEKDAGAGNVLKKNRTGSLP